MGGVSGTDPILIAGGGIGGLAAAIALAHKGIETHVLERDATFSEAGAGIQLGPNAARLLQSWDVWDAIDGLVRPESVRLFDGLTAAALATVPLGTEAEARYGAPYGVAHRAALQQGLLAVAEARPEIRITTGFELARYESDTAAVAVHAHDGRHARGPGLIAADGICSRVRAQLDPEARLRFAGKSAWRTVLDADAAPELLHARATGLWLAPNAHLVHYPIHGGDAVNLVAVIEDHWQEEGWGTAGEAGDLLPHYRDWAAPARRLLEAAESWRKWALFELSALDRWTAGPVALLGDAAHPTLPFLAQGGAMAIEDAAALAERIAASRADLVSALEAYARARKPRTSRVQTASRQMGRTYHLGGLARWGRNQALSLRTPERLLTRFDWLYGFDARHP